MASAVRVQVPPWAPIRKAEKSVSKKAPFFGAFLIPQKVHFQSFHIVMLKLHHAAYFRIYLIVVVDGNLHHLFGFSFLRLRFFVAQGR